MSELSKIVLIDMDGVMADFDSAALINIPIANRVPRSNFYVSHDYPEELRPSIENVYNSPGFFENLKVMPGVFNGWQTLIDNGYRPRVASAPLSSNPTSTDGKIKWLERVMVPRFGSSVVDEAIIDKNKWKYDGLAILDDRPDIPRGPDGLDQANWQHILFGWQHLGKVPMARTAFRLLDWRDVDGLISTLKLIEDQAK